MKKLTSLLIALLLMFTSVTQISISSARANLLIEAAALVGALGIAVLTLPTILGALGSAGAIGIIAARMYSISSAAHTDIENAYDFARNINNI